MKTPYLIQRLKRPIGTTNPFSFGGGRVNGGLSPEASSILKSIVRFDYMGAAEFEWGAVPQALNSLAKADLITAKHNNVFLIVPKNIVEDVKNWIDLAIEDKQPHTKERIGLRAAIAKEKYNDTVGWLKIESNDYCYEPFMFFIDEEMFNNMCKLFGIK